MRPLELVIKGFRSFAERTELDWRERRLVGIVGPIGSGKSSILDAIAFALYGKTPVFSTESKTLIRHGAEHARVELAFEADGAAWRVIRVIRHNGSGRHVLYRDTGETLTTPECEKERDVTARIEEILGLDFSTFCRSVLLAQNRFAEFLNASPGDRDKVLKGVFGFDRLDDMQAMARDRRSDAALALKELEGRLATVEDDRTRLEATRRALELSAEQVRRLEDVADDVRRLSEKESEARRQAAEARRRLAELDGVARQLPSEDEVEELVGALETAAGELDRQENEARQAAEAVAEAARQRDATVDEVGSAEDHARAESRLVALRGTAAQLARRRQSRDDLERTLTGKQSELDEGRAALEKVSAAEEQARTAAAAAAAAFREAREERTKTEAEVGDGQALAGARDELQKLRLARAEAERGRGDHRRLEERLRAADDDLARATAERDRAAGSEEEAQTQHRRAAAAVGRAEEGLHHAEHAEMALALAKTLRTGEPCPVCDQIVGVVQARLPSESLEHARGQLEKARATEQKASAQLLDLSRKAAKWRQTVENVESTRAETLAERREAARKLGEQEDACGRLEAGLVELLGEGDPQVRLLEAEEKLTAADARLATLEQDDRKAADAARDAVHALELAGERETAAKSALAAVEEQLEAVAAELREAEAALAQSQSDVQSLLGPGDPDDLLRRARSRLAEAEAGLASARDAERRSADLVDGARRGLETSRQAQEGLASRLAGLAGQLGHVGDGSGTPRQASRDVRHRLDDARRQAADAEAAAVDGERSAREERRALHQRLELDADADFDAALATARAAYVRDGATVSELEERLERAKEFRQELEQAQGQHTLYVQLADDLTASKFLRYLLEQERAALADLGSERFELLSEGRYRFTTDGTFQVIDQHNAGAERKADTLSGGETFLASLALALALAEKVTAGGGRLDAFFLDEGFGSLDPEHMTLAMEGIERLVTDSPNRLVTVVSHVPEMRERIEDLIELDKDPLTGSTIVRQGARRAS